MTRLTAEEIREIVERDLPGYTIVHAKDASYNEDTILVVKSTNAKPFDASTTKSVVVSAEERRVIGAQG